MRCVPDAVLISVDSRLDAALYRLCLPLKALKQATSNSYVPRSLESSLLLKELATRLVVR